MAGTQGFFSVSNTPYIYMDNDTVSVAMGVDLNDDAFNIVYKNGLDAAPDGVPQITIDKPSGGDGDVTIRPFGIGGRLVVPYLEGIVQASSAGALTALTSTDGQLLIGSSSGAAAFATLSSSDGSVAITNGSNSIDLTVASGGTEEFNTDAGTAIESGGSISIFGGTNVNTAGSSSTVTINLDDNVDLAGTLDVTSTVTLDALGRGVVQSSSAGVLSSSEGTDGQLLISSSSGAPAWAALASADSSVTITNGSNSIDLAVGGSFSNSFVTDSGTATPSSGSLTVSGGTNIATSGSGSTVTVAFDGTLPVSSGGTGATTLTDHGVLLGSGTAAVSVTAVGTSGQILTSNGAGNDPTFQDPAAGGLTYTEITASTQTLTTKNGYIANNGTQVDFSLPSSAAVGEIYEVLGKNNNTGWTITQGAGQTMHVGNTDTTTGAGGSLTSSNTYDWVKIVCITTNTDFAVSVLQGNPTIV